MSRRLIRQEGLLCGGSCGTAAWAAVEVAKKHGPDKRIVTILPDSVRNYMTKFMDDAWMRENGFSENRWQAGSVGDVLRNLPDRDVFTAESSDTLADAVMKMKERGVSQLPVVDGKRLVGIVTESDLLAKLVEGRASLSSAVAEVMFRHVETINVGSDASALPDLFAKGLVAVVVDEEQQLHGLISKMDLVDFLTSKLDESLEEVRAGS